KFLQANQLAERGSPRSDSWNLPLYQVLLISGGRMSICCSAQKAKSKWGTQALEQRFKQKFPHLRILRIDSHSVLDPKHHAFECIAHLNEILTQYDLVIASPSLETGVSIDIRGHFDSVWGIFQGVQPVDSVRQMLARLRETVDRHIWVSRYGMGTVGNGSTSMGGLLRSQDIATQANIALLSASDNDDYSFIDQNFQPESLQTWGKRGAVINVEMRRYQEFVLKGLAADGYTIIDADDFDPDETKEVVNEVKAASKELYSGECLGISQAEEVSDAELKKLQEKRVKTKEERHQQRKAELSRRYEVEVTPDLVEKDDDGWYPQLRLHYYLTLGREFLTKRDSRRAKAQAEVGENAIWKPDFNKGQMLSSVLLLEKLNLLEFLKTGVRLRGSDAEMQQLKRVALENRYLIKTCLNVTISEKLTPIAIAQKLLGKIDLRLSYVGRLGSRSHRESVYKFVASDDGRDVIFKRWFGRDEQSNCESVSVTKNIDITTPVVDTTPLSNLPTNQHEGHSLGDGGEDNPVDSWWGQVKSYATLAMSRVTHGVDAVKQFLSTLNSDERWGVMMAIDEQEPQVFEQLVEAVPDWVTWMG
ncbi:plasmid replication protein, CyRepA1 family, partial [Nostoc parmelioides]